MIYPCIPDYPELSGLKQCLSSHTGSEGQAARGCQAGWIWLRVSQGAAVKVLTMAAVVCKLICGCDQNLITCWLLTGHFSTWSCGSLHRIAHNTALSQNNRGVSVRERG